MEEYHVSKGEDSSSLDSEFNDTVSSIKQTKFNSSDKLSPDSASLMHSVITEREVSLSFGSSDGSPGPDGISAKWIDHASRIEMSQCLLFVFNLRSFSVTSRPIIAGIKLPQITSSRGLKYSPMHGTVRCTKVHL